MPPTVEPQQNHDSALIGAACHSFDELLNRLATGTIGLWEVPAPTLEIWWAGRRSRTPEVKELLLRIEELEHRADSLYERLHNPGKQLTEVRQRRMDQAAAAAEAAGDLRSGTDFVRIAVDAAAPRRVA